MGDLEIIASVVGLLLYWFFTSKKQDKGKRPQVPNRPPMSVPNYQQRSESNPSSEYIEFTDERYESGDEVEFDLPPFSPELNPSQSRKKEPSLDESLKELLEAFDSKKRYDERYEPKKKLINEEEAELKAKQRLGNRFDPEVSEKRAYDRGMEEYWDDYREYESDLLPADRKKVEEVQNEISKSKPKKKNNLILEMLKSPNGVRNGLIMKEILERPNPDRWNG